MFEHFEWLVNQHVPLWAFLLALGTTPLMWGKKTSQVFSALTDRILERIKKKE